MNVVSLNKDGGNPAAEFQLMKNICPLPKTMMAQFPFVFVRFN